ncbi:MAG TPA: TonB-dependent receptor [Terriglobales bacterium]|nr:TonB-dependent receptor [Terriglobales bacterium]
MARFHGSRLWFGCLVVLLFSATSLFAQETTAGLQGTVKDPSGAVVPNAQVVVTGTTLVGDKQMKTDSNGYYRFANLPPGNYTITVKAEGFKTLKKESTELLVGHLPTLDFTLEVGGTESVIEVSSEAPLVDVTTTTNQTNVTEDLISNTPHGLSFQSMIQFAPMARNEPLAGGQMVGGGTGGALPGSSGNGGEVGYSIGGAADSESMYLVEGQDTENISGGASQANVPFEFIQEVQIKTSGIEAEHGGALGGVINVIMKKGGNDFHGSAFATYESDKMDGTSNLINHDTLRYDPLGAPSTTSPWFDEASQIYSPKGDTYHFVQPGFTLGGPVKKDRLWFFVGFAPIAHSVSRTVDFNPAICQPGCPDAPVGSTTPFLQTSHLKDRVYYTTARLDASLTQKVRLFGSWLYQYERETGASLPSADPIATESGTFLNSGTVGYPFGILTPLGQFAPSHGFSQPNSTYNFGADMTLTPKIVATTRFGYFFTNYHDFGWPTTGANLSWEFSSCGGVDNTGNSFPGTCGTVDSLQQNGGFTTTPYDQSFTLFNASKHHQFNQDVAFFKSGWGGTHNFKVGYQLNRLENVISQNGNVPLVNMFVGSGNAADYAPATVPGSTACGLLVAEWGVCAGQYGYVQVEDFATILPKQAIDWNHALFVQDAWTVGHGLTLNLGVRVEKERLPVPAGLQQPGVVPPASIDFSWTDKIAPRLGAAWGSANGKMKIFGSYGIVNDVMKLLLAQTSFGAQVFEDCTYALGPDQNNTFTAADISAVFVNGRACPNGGPTTPANFAGGTTPTSLTDAGTGISLIENVNFRPWEPVAKGVKPYRQHEIVAGFDYQIARDWAFEARYDRRRLDHVIEDASLADPNNFEMYTIVNPGEGVNSTIDGYANYLTSLGSAYGIPNFAFNDGSNFLTCPSCPRLPKAIRNYDGLEFRVTKGTSHGWAGMFSYTWSRLWGNYTGLTTTDQTDGGSTGRNSPDTTRAFDEPFYYYTYQGKLNSGPLPTDRPNTIKGNIYYELPWKRMTTTFGLFQAAYQGSPLSSFTDLGLACCNEPIEATDIFGRGNWVDVGQDPTTGDVTFSRPRSRRTPWYTQTDFNFSHAFKLSGERQRFTFSATILNVFNQHSPVSYWQGFNSIAAATPAAPNQIFQGAASYQLLEGGYDPTAQINGTGFVKNSQYGMPNLWQLSRNIRLGVTYTF